MLGPEGQNAPQDPTLPSFDIEETDLVAVRIKEAMRNVFPDYSTVDSSRWVGYDPAKDTADNGRYLSFYQGEISASAPHIMMIQKKNGTHHVPNYYNSPHGFGNEGRLAVPGDTVYKYKVYDNGEYWDLEEPDDIEMGLDVTRLWMEGMPLTPEVLDQPAFFVGEHNKVVTPRTVIDGAKEYKATHSLSGKKNRAQAQEDLKAFHPNNIFDLYNDSRTALQVKRLVLDRLEFQAKQETPFIMGGKEYPVADLISEVEKGTDLGRRALELEVYKTAVYINMLWLRNIIRL